MDFVTHSHREGLFLFENHPEYAPYWDDFTAAIQRMTDEVLMDWHRVALDSRGNCKSLSDAINMAFESELDVSNWAPQSPIFNEPEYRDNHRETRWRLDFANDIVAVEIAFNHGEAAAWNLLKPALAGELNHVEKAIQSRAGIVVTATEALKYAGNFDGAVGTFEKYLRYLRPMMDVLTVPMVVVGLNPPRSFRIGRDKQDPPEQRGEIILL